MRQARAKYNVKIQHEGAVCIQARFRGHMAQQAMRKARQEFDQAQRHASATMIQSQVRGKMAKRKFRAARTKKGKERYGAEIIQARCLLDTLLY